MNLAEIKKSISVLRQSYAEAGGKAGPDSNHNPCPICNDKSGFSMYVDESGRAKWKCHSKCGGAGGSIIDFVMAVEGLSSKDAAKRIMEKYSNEAPQKTNKTKPIQKVKDDSSGRFFGTAPEIDQFWLDIFAKEGGAQHEKTWTYEDRTPSGEWLPCIQISRFRLQNGKKEIRPARRVTSGWKLGLGSYGTPERPLPLWNKRDISTDPPDLDLHIVEGEKCAEAMKMRGFQVTTSCMGSSNADKTDWTPATRYDRVYIWMDVDKTNEKTGINPGEKYAQTVKKYLSPSQEVLVVDLRLAGMVDGEDVADLIAKMEAEGLDGTAIHDRLDEVAASCIQTLDLANLYPGQPPALPHDFGVRSKDADRPHIRNWYPIERVELRKDKQTGEEKEVTVTDHMQLPALAVVDRVEELTNAAVCRIRSPGAREPLLFLETRRPGTNGHKVPAFPRNDSDVGRSFSGGTSEGRIQFIQKSQQFNALLQRLGRPQFRNKLDPEGTNYATPGDVFHSFAEVHNVQEYEAIQVRPHYPAIPGHYYAWRPETDYTPNGEALAGLLRFFSNTKSKEDLAITLASILTPGWGGTADVRYGCRPLLVLTAADQGSGKTTIAQVIGDLWGGWMPIQLTDRAEEEFIKRALSPGGLLTRVAVIDNVLGTLKSGAIEAWITEKYIRGHRMYQGDASRPNDLTWLVTLNNARLSRDMSERAFFIELIKPEKRADWAKDCATYVARNGTNIILDALSILAQPSPRESLGLSDRWAVWAEEVLAKACASRALREVCGPVDVHDVLNQNNERRGDCDVDVEQAEELWLGILEQISKPYIHFNSVTAERHISHPAEGKEFIFVSSREMNQWILKIQGRKELNAAWVRSFIDGHHKSGRLPHVWYHRDRTQRGYRVAVAGLNEYLNHLSDNPHLGPKSEEDKDDDSTFGWGR